MTKHLFLICFTSISSLAIAQKTFTLEESILKAGTEFAPERLKQLQWIPGTEQISQVVKENDQDALCSFSDSGQRLKTILLLSELNEALKPKSELKSFPYHQWMDAEHLFIAQAPTYYQVDINAKTAKVSFELPEGAEHIKFDDSKNKCSYILQDNLYVLAKNGSPIQVTKDGGAGIVIGQTVHRSEFGIHEGKFWSPDGSKLAFYRMDERMVTDYPLVDISTIPATLKNIKYPMAGQRSHEVSLVCFDTKTGKSTLVKTEGPADQYLCSVAWTPDNASVMIGLLNRDQNHLKMNLYNASSGALIRTLFEEKNEKYVEPEHAAWFLPQSTTEFLWMSERSGYQHLYLYNLDGKMIKQVTMGRWEAHEILGFDQSKKNLLVQGTGEIILNSPLRNTDFNGTQRFIYAVDFELGGYKMLDNTKGTQRAILNDKGNRFIHYFSNLEVPSLIMVRNTDGVITGTLLKASNPMEGYSIGKVEMLDLPAGDGSNLYGRIIKPSNFDAGKKYPVLIYMYGGPHAQMVQNTWMAAAPMWMFWFAEQGYIVATIDNRGSANRGLEFEQATFKRLGAIEMEDQMMLVNHLKAQTYVDPERMAVHGWSYGGFMTINMMITFPDLFKAGVAGGPVCDWSMYEVMYTERYMDTPESNPTGYANANLVSRAPTLKNDLLLIHGTVDDVVVWQHSQSFVKSCIDHKIQTDYFIYPGHEHNVRGTDRVHLMTKVLEYIDEKIGEP